LSEPQLDPDFIATLARLMAAVRDRYYKQQTIHLDGYAFVNCCFHNCTLVTDSGAFSLKS
jgi:hypothetical protein